jgi:outer membrane immunogenic protein
MNKLLVATLSIVALSVGAATAADIPRKAGGPAVFAPSCGQFGGFYVGANGGWIAHDTKWVDRDAWVDNFSIDWALGTVSTFRNGGTAGGQIGYNWQRGCTLFGVELDAAWTSLDGTKTYSPAAPPATLLTITNDVRWFGTARTRAGIIVDNVLLYATGGLAYAHINHQFTVTDPGNPTESFRAAKGRWGGTVGVGVEWAWSNNISIKS